jgi:hypothetical protein
VALVELQRPERKHLLAAYNLIQKGSIISDLYFFMYIFLVRPFYIRACVRHTHTHTHTQEKARRRKEREGKKGEIHDFFSSPFSSALGPSFSRFNRITSQSIIRSFAGHCGGLFSHRYYRYAVVCGCSKLLEFLPTYFTIQIIDKMYNYENSNSGSTSSKLRGAPSRNRRVYVANSEVDEGQSMGSDDENDRDEDGDAPFSIYRNGDENYEDDDYEGYSYPHRLFIYFSIIFLDYCGPAKILEYLLWFIDIATVRISITVSRGK